MRRAFELHDRLPLPVQYKEVRLDCEYRIDTLVEKLVELKRIEEMRGIHEVQQLTYRKLTGMKIGLLMNFNVTKRKDDIKPFLL